MSDIITAITTGFTAFISPMIEALKTAFSTFLYDTTGTGSSATRELSVIAKYIFLFLGVSIGVSMVWLAISLVRRRA